MTPVNDTSPNAASSIGFMKQICSASDFQEGFVEVSAKYAFQLIADKMGCSTPDKFTDGCQEIIEEQWQKHLGITEAVYRDHRDHLLEKVIYGLQSHMRKLIFCVRERKLLSFVGALPFEKTHLCRDEIKEKQRQRLQSETQVVSGRWRRRANPEKKPSACSGNGLAEGTLRKLLCWSRRVLVRSLCGRRLKCQTLLVNYGTGRRLGRSRRRSSHGFRASFSLVCGVMDLARSQYFFACSRC